MPPKDKNEKEGVVMRLEKVVDYVRSLDGERFRKAKEYVERAPPQIDTPIRRALTKLFASR